MKRLLFGFNHLNKGNIMSVNGYVVLKNEFGSTVSDPKLTLNGSQVVSRTSLQNGSSSPSGPYYGSGDSSDEWAVSFNDGAKTGSVECDVTAADGDKTLTVTLNADSFTVKPPVSDSKTGEYDE